jgi:hypothetical protein
MGLDACVYCDCLEKGRLRKPLSSDVVVKLEPNGLPFLEKKGTTVWEDDPEWNDFLCEHDRRRLIHHRIGNIALVALLRWELNREATKYPFLLQKVVYNGIHANDWIGLDQFPQLQNELELLASFKCIGDAPKSFYWFRGLPKIFPFNLSQKHYSTAVESNKFMQDFRTQMLELVEVALRVGKPISF